MSAKETRAASKPKAKELSILQWAGIRNRSSIVLFAVLALVLGAGLSVVSTTHENRFAFNELQVLRDQANNLEVQWGQLLIEQSTFGVEGRIEQKAFEQLQMEVPDIANIVMVDHEQR
ncbi:MAG TPA: cell division protein FtsL [Gammaproteobacteria bacterium]|jgi:cell division protein FtsL|nr:cell division protein FtsL [Pseudomonadales bacterium]MBT5719302.1 cell division protein FtsL [Gammaproteobacteria bacterium]MBT6482754.1 cell division protein FtsL [Gammaproteobacteria bacterium]MBT7226295.1 cell division protein FtsL [Gammaproteobacteria bacterium]HAS49943.1 cell division protein FtsL [Gammaproteobacteria bacterium]